MKKFIFLTLFLLGFTFTSYAQLNIQEETSKDDIIAKNAYGRMLRVGDKIVASCVHLETNLFVDMCMGLDTESAIKTMEDLLEWFEKAKKKEYARIKDAEGLELTIYKTGANIIISEGSGEFIRQELKKLTLNAALGIDKDHRRSDSKETIYGYITPKLLKKTIQILKEEE